MTFLNHPKNQQRAAQTPSSLAWATKIHARMNGYYNPPKKDCFNQLTLPIKSEMWV